MGVLKGLFLGVYTSHAGIRVLFLPAIWLLFASPFVIILVRYFAVDSRLEGYLPKGIGAPDFLPQAFVALVAVLLSTRAISGKTSDLTEDGRKRRVQLLPYWIPGVRHWGSMVFGGESWLRSARDSSISNVIAFNAAGAKHNIVLSTNLLEQLLKESQELEEAEASAWAVLRNAFNMPSGEQSKYSALRPTIREAFEKEIFRGSQMEALVSASLSLLSESLPDLITFNSSIVDQMPWERVAGVELTDGTLEAECDFFSLINEFFCSAVVAPIAGPQFPESYQLLASDLATFNQFFFAFALGLPRFCPIPGLPGAMLAKKRLLQNFNRLFAELTNPPRRRVPEDDESMSGEETDADTPTPLTALNELFTKHDMPIAARTAITLQLLHGIVAELVPLAFWTLLHIHISSAGTPKTNPAEETPIERIRSETAIWVQAIQPPALHPSFPAPPEISFNGAARGVSPTSFPYLRSCINEARHLYKAPITTLQVKEPITLADGSSSSPDTQEQWLLDAGSYIDVGLSQTLINTSPVTFLSPTEYKPDRFIEAAPPSSVTSPNDLHEPLATALLIALVSGVVQLWDISAAPKKSFFDHLQEAQAAAAGEKYSPSQNGGKRTGTWVVPKAVDGPSVKIPKGNVRVRIRRRENLPERRMLRKGR